MSSMMISVLLVTFVPTISLGPVNWLQGRDIYVPFPSEPAEEKEEPEQQEELPGPDAKPGEKPKAKSLGDLMKESGGFGDDDDDDWDLDDDEEEDDDEDEKPKSLQDLMKESGAFDDDDDDL